MNLRWVMLKILDAIEFEGLFVQDAIEQQTKDLELNKQERAFIKKIVFGTIEQRLFLDYVLNQSSKIKVAKMKPAIRHILRLSVYQLYFMDQVPESALVNEAVKLVKKRKMNTLTGFVNGVLRTTIREKENLKLPDEALEPVKYLSVCFSYPEPLIDYLMTFMDYEEVKTFLRVSNEPAPITIRHNPLKGSKEALIAVLEEEEVVVKQGTWLEEALLIDHIDTIPKLKAFKEGLMTVQDESSMLVGHVAYEEGIKKVIDVCSAPGGKATHIATLMEGKGQVLAHDISEKKIQLIKENVSRLKLNNVRMAVIDATLEQEELLHTADVVLADLPCSGLGIIRKKPDIKWHVTKEKISELVLIQKAILANVQGYVKDNGVLVFSTCTITEEENEGNLKWFLETFESFRLEKIEGPYAQDGVIKLAPTSGGYDGFYIAKLRKNG